MLWLRVYRKVYIIVVLLMYNMKIRPMVLHIDQELWKNFSSIVPDTRTKNGTVVELIKDFVEDHKNGDRIHISKNRRRD